MDLKQKKAYLRRELKIKRNAISVEPNRSITGEQIAKRIAALDEFKNSDTVLMFYPVGSEIEIISLFEKAKKLNKKVAFPCSLKGGILLFRYINDLSELGSTVYNIPEPTASAPIVSDFDNSICITPALAFDNDGFRIGYGGGYYDRFLSAYPGISIGVAYDEMIYDELPRDKFDLSVDIIITERRIIKPCQKKQKKIK